MFDSVALLEYLARCGYVVLPGVFDDERVRQIAEKLDRALAQNDASVLRSRGSAYGARNLVESFPEAAELARQPLLRVFVIAVLGERAGLVRGLFFDKPPGRSWSLPWHKDRTIAVKDNTLPSAQFRCPTNKAGVPHVEAPEWLLESMLTLRIHLDPMTAENGPLLVMPGSHRPDGDSNRSPVSLRAEAGDVLAMRPLLAHSSGISAPGATAHRRVIHLELAACQELPDGYAWHTFLPLTG